MTNSDLPVEWFIATLIFLSIIFIMILFISFYSLCQMCGSGHKQKIKPLFRNLTITSIIAFCLTSFTDIIHMFIHMMEHKSFSSPIEPKISGIADMFYYIGDITFYTLLLCRVYHVFAQTQFKLSKITIYIFCIQLIISFLAAIWHTLVVAFFYHSWEQWVQRGMPATYVLSANDFLLNVSLFILFYYKLKQTIVQIQTWNENESSINNSSANLFDVMTKHSVLYSLAIITNQFFFVGVMLMCFTDLGHEHFSVGLIMIMILRSIEDLINVLALWLVLPHNKNVYSMCCCTCHRCVSAVCKAMTKHNTLKQRLISRDSNY
eukprot:337728_1